MEIFYKEMPVRFIKNQWGEFEFKETIDILKRLTGCHMINIKNSDIEKSNILHNWLVKEGIVTTNSNSGKFSTFHRIKHDKIQNLIDELTLDERIMEKLTE